ncbi:MAG: MBL fold metallo-hydrolase [Oscillospiraceae bacterium]|nr:MBL fold metallo-hydrolase [Oscillospiraceae bacterium]
MELTRTANAGILLKLDGITILLDGVCREVKPYPATPPELRASLMEKWPDVVAFTHIHKDHYDPAYAAAYLQQTGRVILGPGQVKGSMEPLTVENVTVMPLPSRHLGAAGREVAHASFIVKGSKCLYFLGDSAPSQWRGKDLPKPDVIVVPYAYVNTPASWAQTQSFGAEWIVLLHMPPKDEDLAGLWPAVEASVGDMAQLLIPKVGQILHI